MRLALVLTLLLAPAHAAAELQLPPGFVSQIYVTGEGFSSGRRYVGGEVEEFLRIYRIPIGGARLTPDTEARYFYGPPLPSPQVSAVSAGREIFVTTFDRDRKVGALYRMLNGRAEFVAGGTPSRGAPALLSQPEGVTADAAGNLYVADRGHSTIVRLDASGRVLDPRYIEVTRPRPLVMNDRDQLWIGSDGSAEAPWQRGEGAIWKVSPQRVPSVVLRGPVPAGISLSPGGDLFVADRHAGKIFFITPEGNPAEFAAFTEGDAPRSLCFAPDTAETRRAGIAGDLFVMTISRGAWSVNEVIRVSGPFAELVRARQAR